MGHKKLIKSIGLAVAASSVFATSAFAGGFDRGAVNIDNLFDRDKFSAIARITYVNPQRSIKNLNRGQPPGFPIPIPGGGLASPNVDVDGDYVVPRFAIKSNVAEGLDCLATYSEPFGGDANYGTGNIYSPSTVEFTFDTQDYGLTCSYQFSAGSTSVGDAFARIIVGGSYLEADGFQSRQSLLLLTGNPGLGTFTIEDDSFGWRAGVAYEIPDIALRGSIVYNSKYDLEFSGIQDITGFGAPPIFGIGLFNIGLNAEIPQSLDVKFQTGIREGTLAFLNFRWQDWSQLDVLPVLNGSNPLLALEPGYQDGYTITAGIGQVITEDLSALAAFTWDRGTSSVSGTQTGTWTLSGGVRYTSSENLELNLGGAIGILEGGSSRPLPNSIDPSNALTYEFDADYVYALSGGFKYKF